MIRRGNWISRTFTKARSRALGNAVIRGIPTLEHIDLIKSHKSAGWKVVDDYYNGGITAHYSKIKLRKDSNELTFEWNNKDGGSIEGAEALIHNIALSHGFAAVDKNHQAKNDSGDNWAA